MKRDFSINAGKTTPHPVVFDRPAIDVAEIHSEIGDVANQASALRERAADLEARVADLRARLDLVKRA